MNKKILSHINIQQCSWYLLSAVLILSAFKNYFVWNYTDLHNPAYFHVPFFDFLGHSSVLLDKILFGFGVASISLLFNKRTAWIPFVYNATLHFYIILSDYFAYHHDVALSSLLFLFYGLYLKTNAMRFIDVMRVVVVGTYFFAGLNKTNPMFLEGFAAQTLLLQPDTQVYFPIYEWISNFSQPLSYYAWIAELIIMPIGLLFFRGSLLRLVVLMALPFHFGIILTGAGTVFNFIYPATLSLWLWDDKKLPKEKNDKLSMFANTGLFLGYSAFSFLWLAYFSLLFIKKIL